VFLVNRIAYDIRLPLVGTPVGRIADPRRGDVVLFTMPGSGVLATKRVVGIGGDVVEMRAGRLVVNGVSARYRPASAAEDSRALVEEWAGESHFIIGSTSTSSGDAIKVPVGHFHVLGDNREHSLDSRDFGPVRREAIQGRVMKASR